MYNFESKIHYQVPTKLLKIATQYEKIKVFSKTEKFILGVNISRFVLISKCILWLFSKT
jgi:hypothetical protein